jgi:histone H3/H4
VVDQIEVIKIPTTVRIWRRGHGKFSGAITDNVIVEYLRELAIERKRVTITINDVDFEVRPTYKIVNGKPCILFFLSKSLNPTWEKLNVKGEVRALITIINKTTAINVGGRA